MRKKGIILGVGVVDVDYKTQIFDIIDGKRTLVWICPFYEKWKQMLRRCYSEKEKVKNVNYRDVTCCKDWLSLKAFKSWMETQPYLDEDGKLLELDKDLLVKSNKIYSPETCVFIHHLVNSFIFTEDFYVKTSMLGVTYIKSEDNYQAQCNDPFKRYHRRVGKFSTELAAHKAYMATKHKYACELADSKYVTDYRVTHALRTRFLI